ncbi:MAG: tyrosine-type recombinase/integrase [Pirellulales bacterium]|nr:tyrosine-type recombinase/integrase [Pirellulales bacterium]
MNNSTQKPPRVKPLKPRPDFPLFPHATRRWAKKVRGKLIYFGPWEDPDGALALWNEQKDDLLAGRTPRRPDDDRATIRDLCESFLQSKKRLVEIEELSRRSFLDYKRTTDGIVDHFGKNRMLEDLRPDDFERFRSHLAKRLGPTTLGNEINRVRVVFKFGFDSDLIDRPVKFGTGFKRPPKRVLRLNRKKNGPRMFEAVELRKIIDAADMQLKAMTLAAINAGLGANDLARLQKSHIDWKSGWLDFPRPKTGIDRRVHLWPETLKALKKAIEKRPKPKSKEHDDLVFITHHGNPWCRYTPEYQDNKGNTKGGVVIDGISRKFITLLKELGLHRPGLGLYACRHTLETIGGEAKDQVALNAVMAHVDDSMAAEYREGISDARLKAVTDHVRKWLYPRRKKG